MSETEASSAFQLGSHVVIETEGPEGTRKYCGYLLGGNEEEFYLKVTHKDMEIIREIGDSTRSVIKENLAGRTTLSLKREAARRWGIVDGLLATRADLLYDLQKLRESELLEDADDGVRLREMSMPIMTMLSRQYIKSMESTDDKAFGMEVAEFGETAAAGFEEMLKELNEKEENDGKEEAGSDHAT